MLGDDPQRLGVIGDHALTDGANPLPKLLGRRDPKLTALELLDEHRRTRRVTARFELTRDRTTLLLPTR
ncbi:MAG: hypothetical protein MSC31_19195 [Solirubrobacteraceae bacterium MAG38_C4-C5]|nr:hypothetical protein [Candidatus Siliceabacter maunaloa]